MRDRVLEAERGPGEARTPAFTLLYLAENVAKVAYNASAPTAPFDADVGAWCVKTARDVVTSVNDATFEQRVWEALAVIPSRS